MEEQEENQKGVQEEVDEVEMLASRRALSSFRVAKDEQRENIFYRRCTVNEKVYFLISNEGNHASDVPLSQVNLPTSTYDFS